MKSRFAVGLVATTLILAGFCAVAPGQPRNATPRNLPNQIANAIGFTADWCSQSAVTADLVTECEGEEIAVALLAGTEQGDSPGAQGVVLLFQRSGKSYRLRQSIALTPPAWAWSVTIEAVHLERGHSPLLAVTYDSGGTCGGSAIEILDSTSSRAHLPVADGYRIVDLDGDGVAELVQSQSLDSNSSAPCNAARGYANTVYGFHEGVVAYRSRQHTPYYRERLSELARLAARLEGGTAPAYEQAHAGFFALASAEESYRIQRLLSGLPAFEAEAR